MQLQFCRHNFSQSPTSGPCRMRSIDIYIVGTGLPSHPTLDFLYTPCLTMTRIDKR